MDNLGFIPENDEHNFKFLKYLSEQENPPLVLLYVTEDNIRNGKPGSIYDCAISQAAKVLFGKHLTVPTTRQIKNKGLCLQVSDSANHRRYTLRLGRLNDVRGFDPEQYDSKHGDVPPGSVLVQAVEVDARPVDKHPPIKRGERGPEGGHGHGDRPKRGKGQSRVWTDNGTSIKGQEYIRARPIYGKRRSRFDA